MTLTSHNQRMRENGHVTTHDPDPLVDKPAVQKTIWLNGFNEGYINKSDYQVRIY